MKRIIQTSLALGLPLMSLVACAKAVEDSRTPSRVVADGVSGLNTKIVSADALWVMNLDLNALRDSTVGKELVAQGMVLQAQAMKGQKFPIQVDVPKLFETIGSITAYGTNLAQDPKLVDGALIFQGTADLRKIVEGIVAQATVTTPEALTELKDLPFEAYSIGGELIVAFPKEPIILVSKSKAQVLAAHKVFRGEAPSLAKAKNSPLTGLIRNQTGAFVLAASVVPSAEFFADDAPQARILQMAKSASVELGEEKTQTFAHVQLLASSDESADKLMKILQGITAMISLAESSDKYLSEFLKSVTVTREKNIVTLHLAYSSDRLVVMAREFQQGQARDRQQRRESRAGVERDVTNGPVPPVEEKVVLQWKADQNLGDMGVSAKTLVSRTVANVALKTGEMIVLTGHRHEGENARIDYVEIAPADGSGASQRIEAEDMELANYTVLANRNGSGGKVIQIHDSHGTARFPFAGAEGTYAITVRYVDENDGKSDFFVSVKAAVAMPQQPEQPRQPEKP
ncbi:hypothetical protein CMV30_09425 [Nibricoccus aquaticus]|uniref:Uncharacterized protein n=1 Tax=Nibricoccus aquaticus TaxID=2576891 RepID=A0A290Q7B3_9BACT|nr:hypothetical protein [Nibricoccus aquaticus]ATC64157.1 hypothetical protein CMV30_09425 [Nibricoccus aquaticus]